MKLSAKFFKRRRLVSDQLAACVLIEPRLCPSRTELPRELVTDPNLLAILRLAILRPSAYRMGEQAAAELGIFYVANLLKMLSIESHPAQAFVWNVDWYTYRLRQLEEHARELHAKQVAIAKFIAEGDSKYFD